LLKAAVAKVFKNIKRYDAVECLGREGQAACLGYVKLSSQFGRFCFDCMLYCILGEVDANPNTTMHLSAQIQVATVVTSYFEYARR